MSFIPYLHYNFTFKPTSSKKSINAVEGTGFPGLRDTCKFNGKSRTLGGFKFFSQPFRQNLQIALRHNPAIN